MLQSTLKVQIKGLSEKEVESSRNINGSNALTKQKTKSIFAKFIENFSDPIIRVLMIALFLNVLFSLGRVNWLETGGIVVAILISTFVSTFSEVGSEKAFIKLSQDAISKRSRVFRCGEIFEIPTGAMADLLGRKKMIILSRLAAMISSIVLLVSSLLLDLRLALFSQLLAEI